MMRKAGREKLLGGHSLHGWEAEKMEEGQKKRQKRKKNSPKEKKRELLR